MDALNRFSIRHPDPGAPEPLPAARVSEVGAEPWRDYGIAAAAYVMPNAPVEVAAWAREIDLGERALAHFQRNGNAFIYRAEGLSVEDLAASSVRRLFDEAGVDPLSIDLLVVTNTMPTSTCAPPESLAGRLRERFGLSRSIAFAIAQLNCTSLVGAIQVLTRWGTRRPWIRRILLVTADVTHGEAFRNRHNSNIQSDASAAVLIERGCPRNRFGAVEITSLLGYHMGFDRVPELLKQLRAERPRALSSLVSRAVARSGRAIEDFDVLIPANTLRHIWTPLAQIFGKDLDFVYTDNIRLKGHTCCADAFINLIDGDFIDPSINQSRIAVTIGSTAAFSVFTLHAAPP